jgi:Amt family ammonium transporter
VTTDVPAATAEPPADAAPEPVMHKGDVAWMIVATVLVMMMIVPGLALFYGGLVRTKNMLSVLTQVITIVAIACLVYVSWGYTIAFTDGNAFFGSFDKLFLQGVTIESMAETFTEGVVIPEYIFIAFQMTFAAITTALIVGSLVERVRFAPLMIFAVLWMTMVYFPIAHMVWWGGGLIYEMGALDFAGGTVVHINAGVAGLVGALILGPRLGYRKEAMPPHSLVMTLIGAGLLWVGWFGFNGGSALEAGPDATLAVLNTFVATSAAIVAWLIAEQIAAGKPSLLGAASGAITGLVAVTPAAGTVGPMGAILIGLAAGPIAYWFCTGLKARLGYDDSLDVFGIHGVAGIVGSVLTGVFSAAALGGLGIDGTIGGQVWIQVKAVLIAMAWSGIGSAILFFAIDKAMGLRPTAEVEREGLDLTEHGERAYNY